MEYSKKKKIIFNLKKGLILISIVLGASFALFLSCQYAFSQNNETKAKEIEIQNFDRSASVIKDKTAQIDAQRLEVDSLSKQGYEWQSSIIKSDFPFDALGASWSKDDKSEIDVYTRFSKDNKSWEDWQKFDPTDEGEANEKSFSANSDSQEVANLLFSKEAQYFQYKIIFADKKDNAYLESIKFTYIKPSQVKKFSLLNYLGLKKAQAVNSPHIISRAEWGADPAYMTWGPEYVQPNKVIIHHTASGNNPPDPAAVVRSIYYYHAVSLGWGDIGYNYLFDQNGNIYEGRAGGNGVVGAHAYGQNYGSIGFSVIGNFSSTNITDATFNSLSDLLAFKVYENDFDINWGTVFGHRDFCNNPPGHNCTACPGEVLYGRKGEIIDSARQKESTYLQRDRDFLNQNNNVLVKSYSQPQVYLWQDGVKRHIIDLKTFYLLNYSWSDLNYVSLVALNEKSEGPILSSLIKTADSSNIYMLKNNPQTRYWITDVNLFDNYGFDWNSVAVITNEQMNAISYSGPLKPLIRATNSTPIYRLASGRKEHFANLLAFEAWGFSDSQVIDLPPSFVNLYSPGSELYNLVWADGANVFLLQNGNRHKVPSLSVFNAWGFKWNKITGISSAQLLSFPEGQNFSRIVIASGGTVYLIDDSKKNNFTNVETLALWGKTPQDAFPANDGLLATIAGGFQVNDLVKSANRPEVYLMYNGKKYQFVDIPTFNGWNKNWSDIRIYSKDLVDEIVLGETILTRFVKKLVIPEEPETYLISGGQKRHLPNPTIFALWGGDWGNISKIPSGLFNSITTGNAANATIKGSGSDIYLLDKGRKDHVMNLDTFNAWGLSFDQVTTVTDQEINSLPTGPEVGMLIRAEGYNPVYKVEDGKKANLPNLDTFYAWGYNFNNVAVITQLLTDILPNDTALSIFAKSSADDPNVYLLNQTNRKQFNDSSILEAWSNNSSPSISKVINNLPVDGSVTQLAQGTGPGIYFILSGKKYHIADWSTFVAWGFNLDQVTILSQAPINLIESGGEMTKLAKGDSSMVYLIDGGKKRHIPSVDVFNSYGWSWSSITILTDSFINQLPDGPEVTPNVPSLSITASGPYTIVNSLGQTLGTANGGERFSTSYFNGTYFLLNGNNSMVWSGNASIKFVPNNTSVIMEILSYYDPNWNGSANYNRFRGSIEVVHSGSRTWAVNELSINDYVAGIAENSPATDPAEKLKAMAVAARTYGEYHRSRGGKHSGEPFHLKNSRRGNGNDQVYAGYGYEVAAGSYPGLSHSTDNQIVIYNGSVILAAYSRGYQGRTRSALEAWGVDYPYLQSVADPYADTRLPCGTGGNHCVGLSASGAIGYAARGSSYSDILRYYYTATAIGTISNPLIRIAIYAF